MREIKFRAWDWDASEMHYDTIAGYPSKEMQPKEEEVFIACVGYFKGKLMQYTGLKDKNGKEIYEGDLFYDEANRVVEVVRSEYGAYGCQHTKCNTEHKGWIPIIWFLEKEVVGNIHQNPELL